MWDYVLAFEMTSDFQSRGCHEQMRNPILRLRDGVLCFLPSPLVACPPLAEIGQVVANCDHPGRLGTQEKVPALSR